MSIGSWWCLVVFRMMVLMLVWLFSDNQCGLLRGRREGCYATLSLSQFEALEKGWRTRTRRYIGGSKPHLKGLKSWCGVVLWWRPRATNSEWGTSSFSYPDINIEHRTQTVFHNLRKRILDFEFILNFRDQKHKNHKEILKEENMSQTLPLDGLPPVSKSKFIKTIFEIFQKIFKIFCCLFKLLVCLFICLDLSEHIFMGSY